MCTAQPSRLEDVPSSTRARITGLRGEAIPLPTAEPEPQPEQPQLPPPPSPAAGPIYRAIQEFNGVAYAGQWREAEDLEMHVGDLIESRGPAPHGGEGWESGVKLDAPDSAPKCFPSSEQFVVRLSGAELAALQARAGGGGGRHGAQSPGPFTPRDGAASAAAAGGSAGAGAGAGSGGMARPEPEPGSAPRILLSPATPRGGRSISINLEHNEYRRKIEAPRPVPPALAISIAGAQQGVDEETGEAVTQYEINVQGKEEGRAGQWWVLRRYSQFADLYAALSEQFPVRRPCCFRFEPKPKPAQLHGFMTRIKSRN